MRGFEAFQRETATLSVMLPLTQLTLLTQLTYLTLNC